MLVEEIIDRLYGLPVSEFTRARNEAERELRKAGERERADEIKALRKPTAAAAAVNRLVREHSREVEHFLRSATVLRDAQVAGKGDIAQAARAEGEALDTLVALGGEPVRATLQAAAIDDNTAREVLQGRLVNEAEPAGFGTLLAHATPPAAVARPPRPSAKAAKPADTGARAKLREAKKTLASATQGERQARQNWTRAQRQLEKAQAAVDAAERNLDRLLGR